MKVFKHWHKEERVTVAQDGREYRLISWGGSSESLVEAKEKAFEKVTDWIRRLSRGEDIGHYEYRNDEVREELIEEIHDTRSQVIGAITRNRYGALILNSASVFIADVDAPEPGLFRRIGACFGKKVKDKAFYRARLKEFAETRPDHNILIYETHSGFRVFVTDEDFDPIASPSDSLLDSLGSDELYQKLCRSQGCYRARLTPKPWRLPADTPPNLFPRETSEAKAAFDGWLKLYSRKSQQYTVCKLVEHSGNGRMTPNAEKLIALHDSIAVNPAVKVFA